jgi:hypothetical protein
MSLADVLITVIDQGNYARVDHHQPLAAVRCNFFTETSISAGSCSLSHAIPSCHHAEVARGSWMTRILDQVCEYSQGRLTMTTRYFTGTLDESERAAARVSQHL